MMWKKSIVWMIVFTFLVLTVDAALCEDRIAIGKNCTMVTPPIACNNYTYDVLSTSGQIVTAKNLTNLNASIYYFTFNQSQGDYIVRLCDNSTRQIRVMGVDEVGGGLSLTLFFLSFSLLLIGIPMFGRSFHSNVLLDLIIRKIIFGFGVLVTLLTGVIVLTIADYAGIVVSGLLQVFLVTMGLLLICTFFYTMWCVSADWLFYRSEEKRKSRTGEVE